MMSPLSIAQFLDPRTARFDVIIFDEASQVRPEDALGALLRGNQVVVLGDTRQLPPTSFFDRMVEADEDDEQELTASVADRVPDYKMCSSLGIAMHGELHEQSVFDLVQAVIQVVEVEGPIHVNEVARRIRSLWGLGRTGRRIREALDRATRTAQTRGQIRQRGDFLWPAEDRAIPVRHRQGDTLAKIDLICDEEIAEAVQIVLKTQYATPSEDLIRASARLLGIRAITGPVTERIHTIIHTLVEREVLQRQSNRMVRLARF
jgi:hypothetical protein